MIDQETWKIGTDRDKVEKLSNTICMYSIIKTVFLKKKKLSQATVEQSTVFFFEW